MTFRNKDDAEAGIIKDNVVDIVCYGNKGLTGSGNLNSWAGGLGMENDNSTAHNLIENITGSVICYDNRIDINTRGGTDCIIRVYHPQGENNPILDDKSSGNNTVSVIDFNCSEPLEHWCQYKYCGSTGPPPPDAPAGLSSDVISFSRIDLSWTDNSENEEGFIIEQKTADSYSIVATVDANVTSFSCTGLSELTEYTYSIQAFNVSGFSDYSNETSATTMAETTTSLTVPDAVSNVILMNYPNPFHLTTRIEYTIPKAGMVSLIVYDMSGREVAKLLSERKQQGTYTTVLNGSTLAGGTYYYRLITESFSMTELCILLKE